MGTRKFTEIKEIGYYKESINPDDVFVIDTGTALYQINGSKSKPMERSKAGSLREKLESERCGRAKSSVFADYDQEAIELIEGLPSKSKVKRPKATIPFTKVLLSLSDKSGRLEMKEIGKGSGVSKTLLDRNDVFILDTGSHCFVWSGAGASVDERKKAMSYAHNY